jgi:hypothetical protein
MRRATALFSLLFGLTLWAAPARADQETATGGAVTATFSYTKVGPYQYSGLRLTISRAGQVLFDQAPSGAGCPQGCWPGGAGMKRSVHVADLSGDHEPEVVLSLYAGGAHCCYLARVYTFTGSGYRELAHDFADPGFRLKDLDGDGVPELESGDARFAYRFTAFASSRFPVQIWALRHGTLRDVTLRHRGRIRADIHGLWRFYKSVMHDPSHGPGDVYEPRGAIAAWAADQYRLGRRHATLRKLHALARRGELPGTPPRSQRAFVSALDRFLRRLGYARAATGSR